MSTRRNHASTPLHVRLLLLVLLVLLAALALIALPATAAQADDTWTGASTSPTWGNASNWTNGVPSGAAGELRFPTLTTCTAPLACYTSINDVSGISTTGLVFSNTSGQYQLAGDGLTVGTQGISDSSTGSTNDVIGSPLTLAGPQTWTVGTAHGYNSLSLTGEIMGAGAALDVTFPVSGSGDLFVDGNMEVGAVTVSGTGGLHIGGPPGANLPGSVNGTDGHPVTIRSGARVVANPSSTTGPLTITGGSLVLGTNSTNTGATTLAVNGTFSIDPSSSTTTFINANGSTPGTDFSQLSATGNIALGGQLVLGQGLVGAGCATLYNGDVATLFATSGTLSGTFAGVPNGTALTMNGGSCQSTPPVFRINYTSNSVIATDLNGPPPPTSALQVAGTPISASTSRATHVRTTRATLDGSVSTEGEAVTWAFEYGRGTTYSHWTRLRSIVAGQPRPVRVSTEVKRLAPDVSYRYRLVVFAQRSGATEAQGQAQTFRTRATGRLLGPPDRLSVIRGTVRVPQSCQSRRRCAGNLLLTAVAQIGKSTAPTAIVCGRRSFRIPAHGSAVTGIRLSSACVKLLKVQPDHAMTVRYSARTQTGQVGLRKRITLIRDLRPSR